VTNPAYIAGLKMLARRELSEAQVRQRLSRLGHDVAVIDEAVTRLKDAGSLDDARTAGAIARTEVNVRHRGRLRVRQRLAAAGITGHLADRAMDEALAGVDVEAQILALLERRLRGRPGAASEADFARLYRYLVGQGFEADLVVRVLRARSHTPG
jgi:regulatory protein